MKDEQAGTNMPPNTETAGVQETCMICGKEKTGVEGIHILFGFICEACELEIVRTDVMDAKYPFFVNRMKQLFYKKDA